MFPRVIFGDRFDFEQQNGFTQMSVNGVFSEKIFSTGNIERDIGILMAGYAE